MICVGLEVNNVDSKLRISESQRSRGPQPVDRRNRRNLNALSRLYFMHYIFVDPKLFMVTNVLLSIVFFFSRSL